MKILAISGSLRSASINSAFCRAVAALAPAGVEVQVFGALGELPLFNPDLESAPPAAVHTLRVAIEAASAVLIASPEYAHGISGPMKNALDWLVSFEGTVRKPVALVNTSARAHHAYEALREILTTMSADLVGAACVTLPLLGACTTQEQMLNSAQVCRAIRDLIEVLVNHVAGRGAPDVHFPIG